MEEDSGSQVRVYMGPLTLKEIRERLSCEKPPEMIKRRATISDAEPSRTIYTDSPTSDYLIRKQFFGSNEPDELSDSFTTEYLTPNETLLSNKSVTPSNVYSIPCPSLQNCNKNDENEEPNSHACSSRSESFSNSDRDRENFIEKVSKVLNLSNRSSLFTSAAECSDVKSRTDSDVPKISLNHTGHGIRETQSLDGETYTIVVSSDEEDSNNGNISKVCESPNNENIFETANYDIQNQVSSSEVCIISSDTDDSFEEQIQIKNELDERLSLLSVHRSENPVVTIDLEIPEPTSPKAVIAECLVNDQNDTSTNLLSEKSSLKAVCASNSPEIREPIKVTVSGPTPKSSLSVEDSFDYEFNDTLEEIEMALKNGLDYMMPEEIIDNCKTDRPALDHFQQPERAKDGTDKAGVTLSASKSTSSNERVKKTMIPIKTSHLTLKSRKHISPIKSPTKQDFDFKVPSKPATVRKTPDFKHVVSPVAVYIKNSPKVPLVQHISAKPLVMGPLFPKLPSSRVTNKENEELPARLYKPAKHTITSKQKEIKLPGNILKHIPNTPTIIKHQGRLEKKSPNASSVEEKLLDEDLTMRYSDANLSTSPLPDVSLLSIKKAYIQ